MFDYEVIYEIFYKCRILVIKINNIFIFCIVGCMNNFKLLYMFYLILDQIYFVFVDFNSRMVIEGCYFV